MDSPPFPTSPCLSSHLLAKLGEAFAFVITGSCFLTCESLPARCPGMEQVYGQNQTGQRRKSTHYSPVQLWVQKGRNKPWRVEGIRFWLLLYWVGTGYLEAEPGVFVLMLVQGKRKRTKKEKKKKPQRKNWKHIIFKKKFWWLEYGFQNEVSTFGGGSSNFGQWDERNVWSVLLCDTEVRVIWKQRRFNWGPEGHL